MQLTYLQGHISEPYDTLLTEDKLSNHLLDIEDIVNDGLTLMAPEVAKVAEATEELKARDPMRRVGLMNCCMAQVEEIIFTELVYC